TDGYEAYGGGIHLSAGTATITHCTFSGNGTAVRVLGWPSLGGGISVGTNGTLTLRNSIVANSTSGGNISGTVIDGGHNICSDSTGAFTAPGSLNNTDPLLGPLLNYGGKTPTLSLLAGSPAIDAADSAFCTATDQRGVPRPAGAGCDIGAYEAAPPFPLFLERRTNNQFRLLYGGTAGQTYRLQQSSDLVNWLNTSTNTLGSAGYFEMIITNSFNPSSVFFQTFQP